MSEQDDAAEKSHEPSQRKLEEARKKGEIPRATDLLTSMAYVGLLLGMTVMGGVSLTQFGTTLLPLIEQPDRLGILFFGEPASAAAGSRHPADLNGTRGHGCPGWARSLIGSEPFLCRHGCDVPSSSARNCM